MWFKTITDSDTGQTRQRTRLYGKGKRYRVRYIDPDGTERSRSFPDRCKRQADNFLARVESEKLAGTYLGPRAGNTVFEVYAESWLSSQTFDESSRETVGGKLRNHVYPAFGQRPLVSITPTHIRTWDREMQQRGLAPRSRQAIFVYVQAILDAAVDDEKIRKNPCKVSSIRCPRSRLRKITPWPLQWVEDVRAALPERYQIMVALGAGLGLRQGECFGLSNDDVDFEGRSVHVRRQVKIIKRQLCFGPPKGGREREVPLPTSVSRALADHIEQHSPVAVTLPWQSPGGEPTTATLTVCSPAGTALRRHVFNSTVWLPALRGANVAPTIRNGGFHALRHFYASTLLDGGESIVALATYLGHHDPGFTLRTYTHLMPSSQQRTRCVIDNVFLSGCATDGTTTA